MWATGSSELSYDSYHEFSKGNENVPSVSWFYRHYGGFRDAVTEHLDVELPKVPGTEYWTRERSAEALAEWLMTLDTDAYASTGAYREFESGNTDYPGLSRLYELFDGWDNAIAYAVDVTPDLDAERLAELRSRPTVTACPKCDSPAISERKSQTPRYRCADCSAEFEEPVERDAMWG